MKKYTILKIYNTYLKIPRSTLKMRMQFFILVPEKEFDFDETKI